MRMANERTHPEIEWRPVQGFEDSYKVSNTGYVASIARTYSMGYNKSILHTNPGFILKTCLVGTKKDYHSVSLWRNNKSHKKYVHHLVAYAFLGPRPKGAHINHIDGDKNNNSVYNLEYCTVGHNIKHAYRLGLNHPSQLRFTEDEILFIRSLKWMYGMRCARIAEEFKVFPSTISKILKYQRRSVNWDLQKKDHKLSSVSDQAR